jgi:hypothetical protein
VWFEHCAYFDGELQEVLTMLPQTAQVEALHDSPKPDSTRATSVVLASSSEYLRGAMNAAAILRGHCIATIKEPRLLFGRKQYLLLLSHMRSYSTVLGHVLGSHDDISGSIEWHRPYRNRFDLLRLRYMTYYTHNHKIGAKYSFDKILHNYALSPRILNMDNVRVIFTLREPVATIRSIINMSLYFDKEGLVQELRDPENVCEYYTRRLKTLERHCLDLNKRALYFDAEDLIHRTDKLLAFLKRELGLGRDMSASYDVYDHTGSARSGDTSEKIKIGRIDHNERNLSGIEVPESILARATDAYEECRTMLCQRCLSPS